MPNDWRRYCRANDMSVDGATIQVTLAQGRRHAVVVEESENELELTATISRQSVTEAIPNLLTTIWEKNRTTQLVGFRVDGRGRLIGVVQVPRVGLAAEEFQLCVRVLAEECDRMEYVLTGRDVE